MVDLRGGHQGGIPVVVVQLHADPDLDQRDVLVPGRQVTHGHVQPGHRGADHDDIARLASRKQAGAQLLTGPLDLRWLVAGHHHRDGVRLHRDQPLQYLGLAGQPLAEVGLRRAARTAELGGRLEVRRGRAGAVRANITLDPGAECASHCRPFRGFLPLAHVYQLPPPEPDRARAAPGVGGRWHAGRHGGTRIPVRPGDPGQWTGGAAGRPGGGGGPAADPRGGAGAPRSPRPRRSGWTAGSWPRSPTRRCSPPAGPRWSPICLTARRAAARHRRAGHRDRRRTLALVLVHGGGPKGKALLDRVKAAGATVVDCPPVKPWELPQFVSARRPSGRARRSSPARPRSSSRRSATICASLAAAVRLSWLADAEGEPLTVAEVRRYFGGRAGGDQLRGGRCRPGRPDRAGHGAAALGDVDRGGARSWSPARWPPASVDWVGWSPLGGRPTRGRPGA